MPTYHIHIRGQVQGVGFRPFVYKLALEKGWAGWVSNTANGVHIEVNLSPEALADCLGALRRQAPALARITGIEAEPVAEKPFEGFAIRHSEGGQAPDLLLSPDFALCPECRRELLDPANRRFGYPFITCTLCGPRYSIVRALPYDRERTVMDAFSQCPDCATEYGNPLDRRYFSQTNSCPVCGIRLGWFDREGRGGFHPDAAQVIRMAAEALQAGQLLALKGIGGYLLLADASREEAIRLLRQRKHRPSKPFAVLYPSIEAIEMDLHVSEPARQALCGPVSPIVLLRAKGMNAMPLPMHLLAPGLSHLGVMLPYAPLLEQLLQAFPQPLIATSGNVSHSPIVFEDEKAVSGLTAIADAVLVHDRPILVPQDDSVLRFTPLSHQPVWLRRSRGMAPTMILNAARSWKGNCLAFGADMKSAFAWLYTGNTYVSQYLGDLDHYDTQHSFRHTLDHFFQLLGARPEHLLTDLHPGYFSHQLAREYASSLEVPVWTVPHHEAHVGAVLAEHDLFGADEPVLAVVFDGTGLGTDGQIWGGEFFVYRSRTIRRAGHLAYFPHLAGDKMAREPRLCALALASGIPNAVPLIRPWFTDQEWAIYAKWQKRPGALQTSSMGRVFDGVAALCGFPIRCTYEGEAAMLLETAALSFFEKHGWETETPYACRLDEGQISVRHLIEQVVRDRSAGADGERIAARFHGWVCEAVRRVAVQENIRSLAFSGGVFQNAVLTELLSLRLGKEFRLYFHREMPSNDENIGIGQIALFQEGLIPGKNVPFDASPKLPVA